MPVDITVTLTDEQAALALVDFNVPDAAALTEHVRDYLHGRIRGEEVNRSRQTASEAAEAAKHAELDAQGIRRPGQPQDRLPPPPPPRRPQEE